MKLEHLTPSYSYPPPPTPRALTFSITFSRCWNIRVLNTPIYLKSFIVACVLKQTGSTNILMPSPTWLTTSHHIPVYCKDRSNEEVRHLTEWWQRSWKARHLKERKKNSWCDRQSSTYFQEWWASSCGASFWTSLWSPWVGMVPGVSWRYAPEQPHPFPQSNLSHSQPCLSQLSPLRTRWMAGSPLPLLSFFHLKLCQVFLFSFPKVAFRFSPPVPTVSSFSCWSRKISAMHRCSQSCQRRSANVL